MKNQQDVINELSAKEPDLLILAFKANTEEGGLDGQIDRLTHKKISYGSFAHERDYLINRDKGVAVVLSDDMLYERALMRHAVETVDFLKPKAQGNIIADESAVYESKRDKKIELSFEGASYLVYPNPINNSDDPQTFVVLPVKNNPKEILTSAVKSKP
jgi:hypothetical protein